MENIKISIYCLSYNCVQFIDRSIKGMLHQKINVNYKIIIHDDASSDGSAEIIKKYAEMYPHKICAILQSENQYSKGIDIYRNYIEPNLEGDYIAICEGDDYWTDENKLQLQYDYMLNHPECSLCTHNTIKYNLSTKKIKKFNNWEQIHLLTSEEVFLYDSVHTSSYFIRRTCNNWPGNTYWFGDYMMLTWLHYQGNVVCLPQIMSRYNYRNPNGVMYQLDKEDISSWISKRKDEVKYVTEFNEITGHEFDKYVKKRVSLVNFQCIRREFEYKIVPSDLKSDIINMAKKITAHEYYSDYIKQKKGLKRLIRKYRYEGYFFYPLWKYITKKSIQHRL